LQDSIPALERLAQQVGMVLPNFPREQKRLNDKIASSAVALFKTDVVQPGV